MQRVIRWSLAVALGGAPALLAQPARATLRADWPAVGTYFREVLTAEGVVGGSLVVFRGDSILLRAHHGFADHATQRRVDDRTIYHWASITKTLTAIAVMQLRERGRLSLDDAAVRHVPELAQAHSAFGSIGAITLRHLLSHSGGFQNSTWPWVGWKAWYPHEPTAWSQLVAMMPYTETLFAPGTRYGYSNPAYIYLGRTIEALAGEEYEVYVEKNVLRPLGMRASYFDRTPYHLLPDRSNNYDVTDGVATPNGLDFDTGITVANGGLNAPIGDLVTYLRFLVGAPGLDASARGVLTRASLDTMWQPVVPTTAGGADSVGLGFFISHRDGRRLIGHTGSQKAFRSFVYIEPRTQSGVVLVLNTAPAEATSNPTNRVAGTPRIGVIFSGVLDRVLAGWAASAR